MAQVLFIYALALGALAYIAHVALVGKKTPPGLLGRLVSRAAPDPLGKKGATGPGAPVDYSDVFPPSRREVLSELEPSHRGANASPEPTTAALRAGVLGLEDDYRLADPSRFVFTGFTVGEIRSLGDFPDYAKLSGVPLPAPLENFDVDKAVPRPYRPFRWAYHQTMSFRKLEPDFWLELENTYRERIRQRQALYAKHGSDVLQALPGSELACKELMEIVLQFLCARYPRQFELADGNKTLVNHILGTRHDLGRSEPLRVLLDNVPEDFAITLRDPATGRYCFRAGVICSSVGWNLGEKIGLGLPGVHGPVPDYKEKMEFSMDRFFTSMPTFKPIQRGSWGLERGQPLYLPGDHPDFAHRESQDPKLRPEDVHLRVDWQTLRRLPLSGGIVFSFKALFTPLAEFRDEPYVPSIVLKVIADAKPSLLKYKGTWHVDHVARPALEEYERFQAREGLIEPDWTVQTLDEYPFFPGWERKWKDIA